jgi:UDP-glucose 4-epimerase
MPASPTNVYGRTKLAIEQMLADFAAAYGLAYVSLRYFNAAGAAEDGTLGEDHSPETHLIPLVLQAALGQRDAVAIFGTDYPTADGTCIRDYIHVTDLADAHVKALQHLAAGGGPKVYNLGSETGYSVRQVIDHAKAVTGVNFPVREEARRPGDPPSLSPPRAASPPNSAGGRFSATSAPSSPPPGNGIKTTPPAMPVNSVTTNRKPGGAA